MVLKKAFEGFFLDSCSTPDCFAGYNKSQLKKEAKRSDHWTANKYVCNIPYLAVVMCRQNQMVIL